MSDDHDRQDEFDTRYPAICGAFFTINPLTKLDESGTDKFVQSLQAWKWKTQSCFMAKLYNLGDEQREIRIEEEIKGAEQGMLRHHLDRGPLSYVQSEIDIFYADNAISYLTNSETEKDTELYDHLVALDKIKQMGSKKRSGDLRSEKENSLRDVFTLFRLAQYPMLTPFEQRMMFHTVRNTYTATLYQPGEKDRHPVMTPSNLTGNYERTKQLSLTYALNGYAAALLVRNNDLVSTERNGKHSGFDYLSMAEKIDAFEMTQILTYTLFEDDFRYGDLDASRFQSDIPASEYGDYYEENSGKARISLPTPQNAGSDPRDPYNFDASDMFTYNDFTGTWYNAHMNAEGRNSFDRLLQARIDYVAEAMKISTINVVDFRQQVVLGAQLGA